MRRSGKRDRLVGESLWRPALAIALGFGLTCLISACADPGTPTGSGTAVSADAAQLLKNITPLERKLLADRFVTLGEYDIAVQATVNCLRRNGFNVSNPVQGSDGLLNFTSSYSFGDESSTTGPSQQDQNRIDAIQNSCQEQSAAVQAVYVLDHSATAQQTEADFAKMVTCFRKDGVTLPSLEKLSDLGSVMQAVRGAMQSGTLKRSAEIACIGQFSAASVQPLPGLARALAEMQNP